MKRAFIRKNTNMIAVAVFLVIYIIIKTLDLFFLCVKKTFCKIS